MIITDIGHLKSPCRPANFFEIDGVIRELETELEKSGGVGLAHNQISKSPCAICIIRTNDYSINLINPHIIEQRDLRIYRNESCLSFPNKSINTARYNEIFVKDILEPIGFIATGVEAVIIAHEVGHLFGETMFDHEVKIPRRNDKCFCGSESKFKKCCYGKEIR